MNKLYQRINWQNYPSDSTPLNESNLNKMDAAVDGIDDRVVTLDVTKLPVATAYTMVKDVAFDEKTGIFTITKLNGSVIKIDTALEKISTNFRFDYSTQKLILTLIDGTTQEVDLSALLTQYEFTDSDTIAFTIDTSGKVVASVKKGSITQDMLEPNYLANVKVEVAKAESASLSADTSAKNAKTSETNSKTSEENAKASEEAAATSATNAKTSEEKAREYAEAAGGIDALISSFATGTNPTIQDSTNAPLIYGKFKGYTLQNGEPTPDNPVEINGLAKDGAIEVKTCGKNLCDNNNFTVTAPSSGTSQSDYAFKEINIAGKLKANKTYTMTADVKILAGSPTGISIAFFNEGLIYGTEYKTGAITNNHVEVSMKLGGNASNFYYLLIYAGVKGSTAGNSIEFSNVILRESTTDATYEPYTETTAIIPTDAPLYEGDYLEVYADGSGRLYKKFMNFNPTTIEAVSENVGAYIKLIKGYCKARSTALCNYLKLDVTGQTTSFNFGENAEGNFSHFFIKVLGLTTKEEYQSWLNERSDLEVIYELAEPTETPLTAEQVAEFKKLYTFEPVTNVLCDGEVEIQYYKNTPSGVAVGTVHRMADNNKATYDGEGNVIAETYAKKSNVLSSVAECEASTNTEDIAGASALSELNEVCLKVKNGANATVDLSAGVKLKDLLSTFQLGQKGSHLNVLELVVQETSSETYENAFLHIEDSGLYLNSTPFTTKLSGKAIISIPIDGYRMMINDTICVNANGSYPKLKVVKARVIYS